MIHVVGDSHVMVFSGKEHIPDEIDYRGFLPFFRTYRLGPYTAYNSAKLRNLIESIIVQKVGPDDSVMLCFGEIDCRVHLIKQSETQGRPLEDVVAECVNRYSQLFDIKEKYGTRLLVWNVPASSVEDVDSGEYSTYGTCRQRNEATRLFNQLLEGECRKREITFVSIFDHLIDEDGLTRAEYYADAIHLSQRAMPLIVDVLRKQMLLDLPLKAAGHGKDGNSLPSATNGPESAEGKRILLWCGIRELAKFIALRPHYDLCYVIEADEAHYRAAERIFKKDRGVRMFRMASVNLLDFCRYNGIERIEKLGLHTGANDLGLVKTVERLLKKKRVNRIECEVPPDRIRTLAKLCGEAYCIEPSLKVDEGDRVRVECVLKKDFRETMRAGCRDSYVFNAVYTHLRDEEAHSVHQGNISVVWSRLPLEACDLYLYVNTYSFTGRQNGLNVLLLQEPACVLPGQYDETIWSNFDHVITLYDKIVEGRERFTKSLIQRSGMNKLVVDSDITEDRKERERKYPIGGRNPGICMINGNKGSRITEELYSKRAEAALWFHEHSAIPFDVFGNPPFSLPNYRGALPPDAKLRTLGQYKYNLCFENIHHPVFSSGYVDKILSCLETRTIPIYLGAPDILTYIPGECFIDFRSFRDYEESDRFLTHMSEKQYRGYIESIDDFVADLGLRPYSWETLYDQLIQIFAAQTRKGIEKVCGPENPWEWGLAPACEEREFKESRGSYLWSFQDLAKGAGEVALSREGVGTERDEEDKAIAGSVDRLRQGDGNIGNLDLHEAMARLQGLIDRGAADVNDHYHYAQCLLLSKAYEQAIPILNRVLELFPNHRFALNDLGVIYFIWNDLDRALSFFTRSLMVEPRNHNTLRNFLVLLTRMGRQRDEMASAVRGLLPRESRDEAIMAVLKEFGLTEAVAHQPRCRATLAYDRRSCGKNTCWMRASVDSHPSIGPVERWRASPSASRLRREPFRGVRQYRLPACRAYSADGSRRRHLRGHSRS